MQRVQQQQYLPTKPRLPAVGAAASGISTICLTSAAPPPSLFGCKPAAQVNNPPAGQTPPPSRLGCNTVPTVNNPPAGQTPPPSRLGCNPAPQVNNPPAGQTPPPSWLGCNPAPQANNPPAGQTPPPSWLGCNAVPTVNNPPAGQTPPPSWLGCNAVPTVSNPPAGQTPTPSWLGCNSAPTVNNPSADQTPPPSWLGCNPAPQVNNPPAGQTPGQAGHAFSWFRGTNQTTMHGVGPQISSSQHTTQPGELVSQPGQHAMQPGQQAIQPGQHAGHKVTGPGQQVVQPGQQEPGLAPQLGAAQMAAQSMVTPNSQHGQTGHGIQYGQLQAVAVPAMAPAPGGHLSGQQGYAGSQPGDAGQGQARVQQQYLPQPSQQLSSQMQTNTQQLQQPQWLQAQTHQPPVQQPQQMQQLQPQGQMQQPQLAQAQQMQQLKTQPLQLQQQQQHLQAQVPTQMPQTVQPQLAQPKPQPLTEPKQKHGWFGMRRISHEKQHSLTPNHQQPAGATAATGHANEANTTDARLHNAVAAVGQLPAATTHQQGGVAYAAASSDHIGHYGQSGFTTDQNTNQTGAQVPPGQGMPNQAHFDHQTVTSHLQTSQPAAGHAVVADTASGGKQGANPTAASQLHMGAGLGTQQHVQQPHILQDHKQPPPQQQVYQFQSQQQAQPHAQQQPQLQQPQQQEKEKRSWFGMRRASTDTKGQQPSATDDQKVHVAPVHSALHNGSGVNHNIPTPAGVGATQGGHAQAAGGIASQRIESVQSQPPTSKPTTAVNKSHAQPGITPQGAATDARFSVVQTHMGDASSNQIPKNRPGGTAQLPAPGEHRAVNQAYDAPMHVDPVYSSQSQMGQGLTGEPVNGAAAAGKPNSITTAAGLPYDHKQSPVGAMQQPIGYTHAASTHGPTQPQSGWATADQKGPGGQTAVGQTYNGQTATGKTATGQAATGDNSAQKLPGGHDYGLLATPTATTVGRGLGSTVQKVPSPQAAATLSVSAAPNTIPGPKDSTGAGQPGVLDGQRTGASNTRASDVSTAGTAQKSAVPQASSTQPGAAVQPTMLANNIASFLANAPKPAAA
eukprot:jgi/Chrzof1/9102/Cz03g36030.t1